MRQYLFKFNVDAVFTNNPDQFPREQEPIRQEYAAGAPDMDDPSTWGAFEKVRSVEFSLGTDQFLVFGDNYPGSMMDVDNVVMLTAPVACGDGVIETHRGEQCEPADESNCPGRCIAQGLPGECTCTPICTEAEPCPLQNGENGPFLTSSGYYSYSSAAPVISVDTCGSDFDTGLIVMRASDHSIIVTNGYCEDDSAPCVFTNQSCTCNSNPNEPMLIRVTYRSQVYDPPAGSSTMLHVRKKVACEGVSVGACCDTNGSDQGCTDNVRSADCLGTDKVWTDQGKCASNHCACLPDCTGAICGDDGCGGSCGTCEDNDVCDGTETCNANRACDSGTPLICNDGNACNGV